MNENKVKYRLKEQARQFFNEECHTVIYPLELWNKQGIHFNLLDEVPVAYVKYGHDKYDSTGREKSSSLANWGSEEAEFRFSIKVSEISMNRYNNINVAQLMDEIQKATNKFFKENL